MIRTMIVLSAILAGFQPVFAADYYVSPTGADTNPGTQAAPFATLAKARDVIRVSGKATKEPVTVHLADGTYLLGDTFTLTARDGGSADAPITYKSENEGKAILSGAVEVKDLNWLPAGEGKFKAAVPADLLKRCAFDELWLGEAKLDMARYPNRTQGQLFDGVTNLGTVNKRAKNYRHPETGYVHAIQGNEWGSVHFRVTGANKKGLELQGGWQQNRGRGLNQGSVMIENILEELDHPGEWFLDRQEGTLYVCPPQGVDLKGADFLATNLRELVSFTGSQDKPVRHINIRGMEFRNARRIFMEDEKSWEPLVRGDWSIVRSAAVFMAGTEDCTIKDCYFNATGGNGVFFNNYNRRSAVVDCRFERLGDSAVCFVGNYACTRSNPIGYNQSYPQSKMDLTPGPKGQDFPKDCVMEGCLVFAIGRVGKQTAGAFISMSQNIAIRHNTIYHVPRSGITVNDGCWGGHVIEDNDVFNTVMETGDHGPFNSWGRDRYWDTRHHGSKPYREDIPTAGGEKTPQTVSRDRARLDTVNPTVIRHNRFMHPWNSFSWGIDLDDGSSNYQVYNNLGLGCTVKLREGFFRRVFNNVFIGSAALPVQVPFDHDGDYICSNIIVAKSPMTIPWRNDAKKIAETEGVDNNLYWSTVQYADGNAPNESLKRYQALGIDVHSISADPKFVDPMNYDFRVADDSPALKLGFKNFPMDGFGVTKPQLKQIAEEGHSLYQRFKVTDVFGQGAKVGPKPDSPVDKQYTILGAKVSDLDTEEEKSIAGVGELSGVYVVEAPADSLAAKSAIRAGDAILAVDGKSVANSEALIKTLSDRKGKTVELRVVGATDRKVRVKLD